MRFLTLLISTILAAPAPISNYKILSKAITDFQATSNETFVLINFALSEQKALLDAFSIAAFGEVNIFLPSDRGFLSLNLPTVTKNDLYTFLQYHFTLSSLDSKPSYLKTFLGDEVKLKYSGSQLSKVVTEFDRESQVLGNSTPISNVNLYFVDEVLRPPRELAVVAKHYNWTIVPALLQNKDRLNITAASKDNTYLVPSQKASEKFIAEHSNVTWTSKMISEIANFHFINTTRLFSGDLKNGSVVAGITVLLQNNGSVVLRGPFNNVTVQKADILVDNGVAHEINGVLLPFEI